MAGNPVIRRRLKIIRKTVTGLINLPIEDRWIFRENRPIQIFREHKGCKYLHMSLYISLNHRTIDRYQKLFYLTKGVYKDFYVVYEYRNTLHMVNTVSMTGRKPRRLSNKNIIFTGSIFDAKSVISSLSSVYPIGSMTEYILQQYDKMPTNYLTKEEILNDS